MQRIVHTLRQIARHEVQQHWHPALAVVKTLHGNDGREQFYACTVQLRESALVLPRVPIATGMTGTAGLPRENDLVVVLFMGGDLHAPVVESLLISPNPSHFVSSTSQKSCTYHPPPTPFISSTNVRARTRRAHSTRTHKGTLAN